ncbi:MAG: ABC transporter ATP-binding protein, partial [Clostridiales bacterium]|nr:ABC transporter ATP-binding protein [Clostridiales bacterium]
MKRKHTVIRLGKYMFPYIYLLLFAVILSIVSNLFMLVGPMLSGYAIDAIEPGFKNVDFSRVFYYTSWMFGFYILSSLLSYSLSVLMIHISRKVVFRMRKDVFNKLMELPIGYFDTHQTGDIISTISYDIDTINTSLSNDLVHIFSSFITIVGAFFMMLI